MNVAARQAVLAQFLNDPDFEQRVRSNPVETAAELAVPARYVEWLTTLTPRRVAAFRASQRVKETRRRGE